MLLACLTIALTACGDDYAAGDEMVHDEEREYEAPTADPQSGAAAPAGPGQAELVLHPFRDQQSGMLMVEMPFPASWRVAQNRGQGEPSITGPNELKIFDFPAQNFIYTDDPQMQQVYYQSGQPVRPMPGIDALIRQDVEPWAAQQGLRFVRRFNIPEVARVDQWYHEQLYQAVPTRSEHAVIGSDWETANGDKFFLLMHLVVGTGGGLQTWFYYSRGLQAETAYYETAKKHLIFGLANARYNPQYIQAYNQREAQKAGQSWAAHNQRMRNNQASFEASQRAIVGANDAVNDSIMQGWRDRNAIQESGHDQYIDSVRDKNTMVDPSTGQAWEVDSGANEYWINPDGEYLPTDDYNYNPNIDPAVDDQDWQRLEEYPR